MDKSEIVDRAISYIDVNYVETAIRMTVRDWRKNAYSKRTNQYLLIAAAIMVLLLLAGGIYSAVRFSNVQQGSSDIRFAEFVNQAKTALNESNTEMLNTYVQVGDHVAEYELIYMSQAGLEKGNEPSEYASVGAVNEEKLNMFVGDLYSEVSPFLSTVMTGAFSEDEYQFAQNCSWYKVKGSSTLQYLIRKGADGSLSIWGYIAFQIKSSEELKALFPTCRFETYTYGEVLEAIYCVDSADDILSININPSGSDHTPEGKAIREATGSITIEDRDTIISIYKLIREMECYGCNSIDLQQHEVRSSVIEAALRSNNSVRTSYLREVLFTLTDESVIDSLKYSAIWGAFYENNGIAYQILSDEEMTMVNELFAIHAE